MKEKLVITQKPLKGEDGYKTFSIRIKKETAEELERLASKSMRSRNELINMLLDFAIANSEIQED